MLNRALLGLLLARLLSGPIQAGSQATAQEEQILERGDKALNEAKSAYEDARTKSSVPAFVDAGFKLEEARIKFIVLQEIGSPEKQKIATDRLRAVNQLSKLIHDGKVAISGSPADAPPAKSPDPPVTPPAKDPLPNPPMPPADPPGDVTKRAPVPDATKQKEAEKLAKELFKDEYAKKTPADRRALARLLLNQAAKTQGDLVALWVLYHEAQEAAVQGGDIKAAIEAIEAAAQVFDVDTIPMKNLVITAAAKTAKMPGEFAALTEAMQSLIEELVRADQYDAADKASNAALQFARKASDQALATRVTNRAKDIAEAKTLFQAMKSSLETQAKNPDDPGANLEIGQFLCFVKGSWDLGVRFLVKGSDATLKALAEKEVAGPAQPADWVVVADGWYDLAGKEKSALRKGQLLLHAKGVYECALSDATGLVRAKIEKRLEILQNVGPSAIGERGTLDLFRWIDPQRDAVHGQWTLEEGILMNRGEYTLVLQIPYEPPDEYDLHVRVKRVGSTDSAMVGFVVAGTQAVVIVDGYQTNGAWLSGFEMLDGKLLREQSGCYKGKQLIVGEKPTSIELQVRKTSVTLGIDGKKLLSLEGSQLRLSNRQDSGTPDTKALYIGAWNGMMGFTDIRISPLSGPGKKTR